MADTVVVAAAAVDGELCVAADNLPADPLVSVRLNHIYNNPLGDFHETYFVCYPFEIILYVFFFIGIGF
jgi:hypothetical protein